MKKKNKGPKIGSTENSSFLANNGGKKLEKEGSSRFKKSNRMVPGELRENCD